MDYQTPKSLGITKFLRVVALQKLYELRHYQTPKR